MTMNIEWQRRRRNRPAVAGCAGQELDFAAWEMSDVPFGDTLNLRKFPASTSQKQAAYPNGTVLQMTGRCTGGRQSVRYSGQKPLAAACARPLSLVRGLA